MFWKILLCIRKFPCVLEKIVVFPNRLLCSRRDCCVLNKIVVFSKRLLCSEKDCCVAQKIVVFFKRLWCFRTEIELCFAPMGHRKIRDSYVNKEFHFVVFKANKIPWQYEQTVSHWLKYP